VRASGGRRAGLLAYGGPLEEGTLDVLDAVRDVYRARWGDESRRAVFRTRSDQVEILKWGASGNGEGVDLYATLGASAVDLPGAQPGHRVEFFVGLRPGQDDIASALAALGLFARREQEFVGHGHTIPADGPLWPGTQMKTFLVLSQVGEIIPPADLFDGVHVEFLQAVPVFESERQYKIAHGADALVRLWERAGTPFWDPNRCAARSLIPVRGRTGSRHREEFAFPTIRSGRGGSEGAEGRRSLPSRPMRVGAAPLKRGKSGEVRRKTHFRGKKGP